MLSAPFRAGSFAVAAEESRVVAQDRGVLLGPMVAAGAGGGQRREGCWGAGWKKRGRPCRGCGCGRDFEGAQKAERVGGKCPWT